MGWSASATGAPAHHRMVKRQTATGLGVPGTNCGSWIGNCAALTPAAEERACWSRAISPAAGGAPKRPSAASVPGVRSGPAGRIEGCTGGRPAPGGAGMTAWRAAGSNGGGHRCQVPSRPQRYQRPQTPNSHHSPAPTSIRDVIASARCGGMAFIHHGEAVIARTSASVAANGSLGGAPGACQVILGMVVRP